MNEKISSDIRLWTMRILFITLFGFVMIPLVFVFSLNWVNPPVSSYMLGNKLENPQSPISYHWKNWDEIGVSMPLAVIAAEQDVFSKKYSLDPDHLRHLFSLTQDVSATAITDTISNRTVRNLFLWNGDDKISEGLETWLTLIMETTVDKQRILEIYLNIIEFSPNVYGIEAASQKFFFKPANKLTIPESASLAAILPEPTRHNINSPNATIEQRQREIIDKMKILDQAMLLGNNLQDLNSATIF